MFNEIRIMGYLSLAAFIGLNIAGTGAYADDGAVTLDSEIPRIDRREYDEVKTATFALGCFWGGDARFGAVPGVIRTRVGYAGGTTEDPTYYNLGDHTESIQVDYYPEQVTFVDLVDIFWAYHNPTSRSHSAQYANVLYYHDTEQKKIAEESKRRIEGELDKKVHTQVKEMGRFYPAEDYHQKHRLRGSGVFFDELNSIYSNPDNFRDSTAAARLNGFLAGNGSSDYVKEIIDELGLSDQAREELLQRLKLS
ncbi:MAG: peptide-methionine (S)-S-oxide reductase MsrA [Candidatus Acetothermia bacterium]